MYCWQQQKDLTIFESLNYQASVIKALIVLTCIY